MSMHVCMYMWITVLHLCVLLALACTFGTCRDRTLALGSYQESVAIVSVATRLPCAGTHMQDDTSMSSSPPCYVKAVKGAVYLSSSVLGHLLAEEGGSPFLKGWSQCYFKK